MHKTLILAAAGASLALSACASTGGGSRYAQEFAELQADCTARGGILAPRPGSSTGNPGADNTCEIRGGASRID